MIIDHWWNGWDDEWKDTSLDRKSPVTQLFGTIRLRKTSGAYLPCNKKELTAYFCIHLLKILCWVIFLSCWK